MRVWGEGISEGFGLRESFQKRTEAGAGGLRTIAFCPFSGQTEIPQAPRRPWKASRVGRARSVQRPPLSRTPCLTGLIGGRFLPTVA